ncbi:glucosyltransferase domain-containing protein [Metaclostridioides mangenotii]|uniref:glucosyltransferase domain-containing protein n=1 Tax=Metaclostridioides mangenotii TaxID=1540 RepID=UPI000488032F|nr:glucosyltransferase domain-containing protein [Clostridioides mangenotii]
MEEKEIYQVKEFIKDKSTVYCFFSSIFFGLLSYLYFFVNNLYNHDSITNTPKGYGAGASSGRWFLSVMGDFVEDNWGNYNIPLFNGILAIFILAITCCIIIKIFDIKNKWLCVLVGGITVVFPPIASAMIYSFTVAYYTAALFLTFLGIYLIKEFKLLGFIMGVLLFSFSIGIYQAYYPLCGAIFLLILIKMCMDSGTTFKQIILTGIKFLISLAIGYLLYNVFLQFYLNANDMQLSNYQGIDQMGQIDIKSLPMQIKEIYKSIGGITFRDYMSISATKVIQNSFIGMYIINCIAIVLHIKNQSANKESVLKLILLAIFILILPIAVNFVIIMVPNGEIYTLMQMGFVSLFYLTILLVSSLLNNEGSYEKVATVNKSSRANKLKSSNKYKLNKVVLFFTLFIVFVSVFNYTWQNNGNYRSLYFENKQLENYYQTLMTRIKSIEDYTQDKELYFVGEDITDKTFDNERWRYTPFKYGGNSSPLNTYSRKDSIENFLGYRYIQLESDDEVYKSNKEEIEQMDLYPNFGGIKIIENKIFVRFE